MNRERIRRLASEELELPTSRYAFASSLDELREAIVAGVGFPCFVKPVMSSSGKGQSVIRDHDGVAGAWTYAQAAGRVGAGRVIVEAFVQFDYEITLLTIRHAGGTSFCAPIGHLQRDGDYRESWQPHAMQPAVLDAARAVARQVTDALGGTGIFGVELFVRGEEVLFSEVSPRPHDTGMVTMATQALSEFALHVRAILGLPVPAGDVPLLSAGASAVCLATANTEAPVVFGVAEAMAVDPGVDVRVFAKPDARPNRRMAVALARGADPAAARAIARAAAARLHVG
jgi:phosphoribosylglycinamide formyltransferase 2